MSKPGKIVILSGPSGVGKSTVRDLVVERSPVPLKLSVSATTRLPRGAERNDVDYHFLTPEAFEELRQNDAFIECKQVYGRNVWYGTLRDEVEDELRVGRWVMLEIDVDGTADVVRQYPDAVTVFILPPSMETLEKRLRGRGTESDEAIERRLARAAYEIEKSKFYKYPIVNDVLEKTVTEFCDIISHELQENWND